MSNATNKLEMSLDDIIKAQKGKAGSSVLVNRKAGPAVTRKGEINGKKHPVGAMKGGRTGVVGRGRQTGPIKNKRIGQFKGRRVIQKRVVRPLQRNNRPISARVSGVRKNSIVGNNAVGNRAMLSVTRNLVKKLIKKALVQQNVASTASNMIARRTKFARIPANRIRQRTIGLNRINPRSRVIARRVTTMMAAQNSPMMDQRVRGPVRFIPPAMRANPRLISLPRRRNTAVQYVQQPVMIQRQQLSQQRRPNFGPRNFNNIVHQPQLSVRDQINAMRRASQVQQLQRQFIKQQQQPRAIVVQQQPQRRQQQVIVRQQPRRRQPQQQQYIILQQQPQQRGRRQQQRQFIAVKQQQPRQQQFIGGGRGRGQGRQQPQQIMRLDPFYSPPNYLQRI